MSPRLPEPIANYVGALARRDVEGMVEAFAADGLVIHDGQMYRGRPAIRAWIEETSAANGAILTPDIVCHETGRIVVEGLRSGDADGHSRRFVLAVELEGAAILTMEISR